MSILKKGSADVNDEQAIDTKVDQEFVKVERGLLRKSKKSKVTETIEDDYDESDWTSSDADAHRDVSYELPPTIKQIWICYMTQMKRFTKEGTVWTMLILLMFIPVFYFVATKLIGVPTSHITNVFLSLPLFGMPLIATFICSSVCGTMLPREYNERTIYLSLPLPMPRSALYVGKFLAGLSLCIGVITAAYGISILLALTVGNTDETYTGAMFSSLAVMLSSAFFFCSFVYMLSAKSKRGATLKALILLVAILPILISVPSILMIIDSLEPYRLMIELIEDILIYLPIVGPNLALNLLGDSGLAWYFMMDNLSAISFANAIGAITLDLNAIVMCIVAIVLGILCLLRGFMKIKRRDM